MNPTRIDVCFLVDAKFITVVCALCRDIVQDMDNDRIDIGHAIMTFYSALIDLLGRCAPERQVSAFAVIVSPVASICPQH